MIIDSHQHFWNFNSEKNTWITDEMNVLKKNFYPNDLITELKKNKVDGCISVQVEQTENETESLIRLSEKNNFIKGVIGWVDLKSPEIESVLNKFSKNKALKGIRHIVQSEKSGFLLNPDFLNGVSKLNSYNLTYDILVYPNQLDEVIKFVEKFPKQTFVLDHLGKPLIKEKKINQWKEKISELSVFKNVSCKISGMITEANWEKWKIKDFKPYIETVQKVFGEDRLLYGSDWPVCLLAGNYLKVKSLAEYYFPIKSNKKYWSENAIKIYNLNI